MTFPPDFLKIQTRFPKLNTEIFQLVLLPEEEDVSMMAERMYSRREMGVFSRNGSYLCSTFCGPITCTQAPFRNNTYRRMSRDYPGEEWACLAGMARTCAACSAVQSRAPRHHSEIIHIEECPGTIQERNGRVQQERLVFVQHVLRSNHVHLETIQKQYIQRDVHIGLITLGSEIYRPIVY